MELPARKEMLRHLDFFIGTWKVEITHPHLEPTPIIGHTSFEWLDDSYVVQRMHIEKPEFPSSMIVYEWHSETGRYLQHYFDSRGVTRLYQMTFEDRVWKLWRDSPDFSSLDFCQRFVGEIDEAGNTIESSWEQSGDGVSWTHDFKVLYRRNLRD
ncbi:hypothetical protein QOZ98_001419 [Planomicrobium stackebrandtii]|uniref:DUF1579 domain-containing protein n=1 Tax=Planomicrobium stackebrandtii TaxID=253160 RepID=A0ABU0GTG6_9BACL|nr:hypothetical protein [Planomicrobium stackebrandtii]MDQ0428593.1 hypothetical protein [Planomicrobium stackebrandtii]